MCLAIPGKVLSLSGSGIELSGRVRFGDIEKEVNFGFTPEVKVSDFVIVHVGCAINIMDEVAARQLLTLLHEAANGEAGDAVSR